MKRVGALAVGLVLCVATATAARGQIRGRDSETGAFALEAVTEPCSPPYRSACPVPDEWVPECRVDRSATRGGVTAEIVYDGWAADLQAVHLVVRRGTEVWIARELGHAGVGCGTDGLYAADFEVVSLSVRDVLFGSEPEVLLRTPGPPAGGGADRLLVCTTDTSPPRCNDVFVEGRVRYRRPATIRTGEDTTLVVD